jgi:SAM-dependent methyltransferase
MDDAVELLARTTAKRSDRELRVLDVACSSGVATVELHEGLRHAGFNCETHGTDLLTEVELVEEAGKRGLVFDPEGNVLRIELGSDSMPWPPLRSDPILRPLRVARAAWYLGRALPRARRARRGEIDGYHVTRVPLTTAGAEGIRGLSFQQEDIHEPRVSGSFDLVRAANILNLGYFREADLQRMIRAILKRVAPRGFLLVLRTGPDGVNRGTVYERSGDQLAVVEHLHGGSEVHGLVTAAAIGLAATGQPGRE